MTTSEQVSVGTKFLQAKNTTPCVQKTTAGFCPMWPASVVCVVSVDGEKHHRKVVTCFKLCRGCLESQESSLIIHLKRSYENRENVAIFAVKNIFEN